MRRGRRALSLGALLLGAVLLAQGLWIPAKAELAQALLEHAWTRVQQGDDDARPWPWADTTPVARVLVPRLDVEVIALSGASGRTMAFGPGHVPGTAAPGTHGNVALAGHRDTHFAFLRDLVVGDEVRLIVQDGSVGRFLVEEAFIAHESETWVLAPSRDDRLTLVTCWPFDAVSPGGDDRYVVVARRSDDASVRDAGRGREAAQRELVARAL